MRYLIVIALLTIMSGCSWWPFGGQQTDSCLDDDSCQTTNPFEEALVGGTWYCYGTERDSPWDCSQEAAPEKIASIPDPELAPAPALPIPARAEISLNEESISTQPASATEPDGTLQSPNEIFEFTDSSYAIQLIALQTLEEIDQFAVDHQIEDPQFVRIRSQGSDWYVMLLGVYPSHAEADRVAEEWSALHQPKSKPWVRPLGPLKRAALEAEASGS